MDYEQLLAAITPEIYQNMKQAIELGRWADGRTLTVEQRENTLQAIIAYEHKYFAESERTGFVPPKKTPCATDTSSEESPLKWSSKPQESSQ